MQDISRRSMIAVTACALCSGSLFAQDRRSPKPTPGPFDAGKLSDYPDQGPYDKFVAAHRVLIVRQDDKLYAMTSVCTHKFFALKLGDSKHIFCPGHGSTFDNDGVPEKGPAKAALDRHQIKLDGEKITIDTSKTFGEQEWEKEGASIKLK